MTQNLNCRALLNFSNFKNPARQTITTYNYIKQEFFLSFAYLSTFQEEMTQTVEKLFFHSASGNVIFCCNLKKMDLYLQSSNTNKQCVKIIFINFFFISSKNSFSFSAFLTPLNVCKALNFLRYVLIKNNKHEVMLHYKALLNYFREFGLALWNKILYR